MAANNRPVSLRFVGSRVSSNFKNRLSFRILGFLILIGFLAATFYSSSSASLGSRVPTLAGVRLGTGGATAPGFANKSEFNKSYKGWGLMAPLAPLAGEEMIVVSPPATRAPGCSNPNVLCLGETVTAVVSNAPLRAGFRERRIQWVAPDGSVPQVVDVITDPQTDTYMLPTTGSFAQVGTWEVRTITNRFGAIATTKFEVGDPTQPSTDLAISVTGPTSVTANTNASYNVTITNNGPDAADNVSLFNPVPYNSTFVSASTAAGFSCTLPAAGDVGDISCTKATLAASASAAFTFVFSVNSDVKNGSAVYEWAKTETSTNEPDKSNNISDVYASSTETGGGGGTCSLDCPEDITAIANTEEGGQRGAHVTYTAPVTSGDCGTVTSTPASGSFFPVGNTTVTSTSELNGGSCSFTVTVDDQGTNPPIISCPSNKNANADSNCAAVVAVGTATATGNNVTITATRSDGKPMYNCDVNGTNCTRRSPDEPFAAGITTITWTAYSHDIAGPYQDADQEEAHRTGNASCTQTINVDDVTPPTIDAPPFQTASADANCMAPVPDFTTSASVSDNCACSSSDIREDCADREPLTVTQSPAPGTMVGLGSHDITLTANDGSSHVNGDGSTGNTATAHTTFTVNDTTAPVISCPANVSNVPTETGTCAAHVSPGTATATDNCDSTPTITGTRSDGQPLTATYPRGTTTITWTATDDAGNHSSCTQTITVVDVEPPVIVLNGQTPSMWPPNHKYQTFQVTNFVTGVTDNCDSISVSSVYITKVTSDEIENGNGDGNTFNDIVIAADCKSIQLRAEREGDSNGRVYTIFFSVQDTSGNVGTATATVVVRHNPGQTAVDSGPHYTVMSSCP
ncbi:MAG: hypothetical protein QOI77_465 [Blastocatellia bacterium]|nr:hypothetical protein [Blastocatellia bacterium]